MTATTATREPARERPHRHERTCYWDVQRCRWVCPEPREQATARVSPPR